MMSGDSHGGAQRDALDECLSDSTTSLPAGHKTPEALAAVREPHPGCSAPCRGASG